MHTHHDPAIAAPTALDRLSALGALLLLLAALTPVRVAHAEDILQDNDGTSTWLGYPVGQSFTAVDTQVVSAAVYVWDRNPHLGVFELTLELVAGEGYGGEILGSYTRPVDDQFVGWFTADFSEVVTTPGQVYTLRLSSASGRGAASLHQHSTSSGRVLSLEYAGGHYLRGGIPVAILDMRFLVEGSEVTLSDGEDGQDDVDDQEGVDDLDNVDGQEGADDQGGVDEADNNVDDDVDDVDNQEGVGDEDGVDVQEGEDDLDGDDDSRCTVTANEDGSYTISCEDGGSVTVRNGRDGAPDLAGAEAADCAAREHGDGTYSIRCGNGDSITVRGDLIAGEEFQLRSGSLCAADSTDGCEEAQLDDSRMVAACSVGAPGSRGDGSILPLIGLAVVGMRRRSIQRRTTR